MYRKLANIAKTNAGRSGMIQRKHIDNTIMVNVREIRKYIGVKSAQRPTTIVRARNREMTNQTVKKSMLSLTAPTLLKY